MTEAIIYLNTQRAITAYGLTTQMPQVAVIECWLAGGQRVGLPEDSSLLLIPYIGDFLLQEAEHRALIEETQVVFFDTSRHEVVNPYDEEAIQFFVVVLPYALIEKKVILADVQTRKNELIALTSTIFLGQYDGRRTDEYTLKSPDSQLIVYVLSGVFEVQNRLLHAHDGLALKNIDVAEFEALSNDAVLLIIELPNI